MTRILASAMVITMALALFLGVFLYGAVDPDVAAPMYFLALIAAALWGLKLILSPSTTWRNSPMHWPALGFGVYALLRYFAAPVEYEARIELLHVLLCVLAYFTACQFHRPVDRTVLTVALMLLVAFESTYALWQFSTGADAVLYWNRPDEYLGRGGGTYICPNNLAGFLEMALGIFLGRGILMTYRKGSVENSTIRRLLIIYVALMALVGIAVSLSRGGWAATLAGLVMFLAWGDWRSRSPWIRTVAFSVAIGLFGLVIWKMAPARVLKTVTSSDQRGMATFGLGDKTLNSRLPLWTGTMKLVREQPVLGSGPGSWQWVFLKHKPREIPSHPEYTHNDYLNILSDYGAIGMGLMLWFIVGFFRQAAKGSDPRVPSEERSFVIGAVVGITALLVHFLFDFNLHIPANALVAAVIMGSVAAIEDPDRRFSRAAMPAWGRVALGLALVVLCGALAWQFARASVGAGYTRLGNDYKRHQLLEPDAALGYYNRAILADPRFPTPHWKIGDLFRSQAQWRIGEERLAERKQLAAQATDAYEKALRLNPYLTEVQLRSAHAWELQGDDGEALKKYLKAIELAPMNSFSHFKLGKFYHDRDDLDNASKHLEESLKLLSGPDQSLFDEVIDVRQKIQQRQATNTPANPPKP